MQPRGEGHDDEMTGEKHMAGNGNGNGNGAAAGVRVAADEAVRLGLVADVTSSNPTGNKLEWKVRLPEQALDRLEEPLSTSVATTVDRAMSTREVETLLTGLLLGRLARGRLAPSSAALSDSIAAGGRVEVTLRDPASASERKRTRNAIFNAAYRLGLKGQFAVHQDGDRLIGQVTGGAAGVAKARRAIDVRERRVAAAVVKPRTRVADSKMSFEERARRNAAEWS